MNALARNVSNGPISGDGIAPSAGPQLAIVLAALGVTALLYWPTSLEIADVWQDTVRRRYTHGWAVLAVVIWLLWRDRAVLGSVVLAPSTAGLIIVALLSIVWLVGFNAALLAVSTLVLPLLVLATIWAVGGLKLARLAAFPLLLIYFALPIWEVLTSPLQWLTALVSGSMTELVGVPVMMDENVIHIPEGWFAIADGCSGLHFFVVALAIAAVHGEVDGDRWHSRLLLMLVAGLLALATNWVRVSVVIMAGHLTDMQHFLVRVDHYYFGWLLFAFALVMYVLISSRLPRIRQREPLHLQPSKVLTKRRHFAAMILSFATLSIGPVWAAVQAAMIAAPGSELEAPILTNWSGPSAHDSKWQPVFKNPDEEYLVSYESAVKGKVALYFAAYHSQRQGKELLGSGNSILGRTLRLADSHDHELVVDGAAFPVSECRAVRDDGRELLLWSLSAIDGKPSKIGWWAQLAYGVRSLVNPPTATVIALAVECGANCSEARGTLGAVFPAAVPAVLRSTLRSSADTAQ